jgi:hypothetical protein
VTGKDGEAVPIGQSISQAFYGLVNRGGGGGGSGGGAPPRY